MSQPLTPLRTTRHLESLRGLPAGETPSPPIAKLIGITTTHVELGRSVLEMDASERHANPMGTLHGGVICDLADLAMGTAFATTLEDDETFTTLDLTTKFFKPIWSARIRPTAPGVKRPRRPG